MDLLYLQCNLNLNETFISTLSTLYSKIYQVKLKELESQKISSFQFILSLNFSPI